MTFFRSRTMLALIGLLVIGGVSAAVAVLTAPQPVRTGLISARQPNGTSTAGSTATTTGGGVTAGVGGGTTTSGNTAGAAPTATRPSAPPTNLQASGDVSGQVATVSASGGYFTMTVVGGSTVKVVVTSATTYQGSAQNLASLRAGWKVEVHGTSQADGSFLAADVNSDSGA